MVAIIFISLLILLGLAFMAFAIFGKEKDFENVANSVTGSGGFLELILCLIFATSTKKTRVIIFILGFLLSGLMLLMLSTGRY